VEHALSYARQLGLTAPLANDLSLALGSSAVNLLELTTAYATFANLGIRPEPLFVVKITDKEGNLLEENVPVSTVALPNLSRSTLIAASAAARRVAQPAQPSRAFGARP